MSDFDKSRPPEDRIEAPHQASDSASRREFLKSTAAGLLSITLVGADVDPGPDAFEARAVPAAFKSRWPSGVERYWIGPEYWSNPLQHWRLADGRLELIGSGPDRNVQLLTRSISGTEGMLEMRVALGFVPSLEGSGEAGFEIGIRGPLDEYRNNAVHGSGTKAGIRSDSRLYIEGGEEAEVPSRLARNVVLHLSAESEGGEFVLTLRAVDPATGEEAGRVTRRGVPADMLAGNLALFGGSDAESAVGAEGGNGGEGTDGGEGGEWGTPRLWFRDLTVDGSLLDVHDERAFGPVLFTQYTVSRGIMKMTAQMPPLGGDEEDVVRLEVLKEGTWSEIARATIDDAARTARFRVPEWDASQDVPYRLLYRLRSADGIDTHAYEGRVRSEPSGTDDLVMGVLSCATDPIFPNVHVASGLAHHDPDLLAFTGDQFYESSGGYGVERRRDNVPLSTLDYLRKWYMHGWSFGELMRDRPTICMPDDHDVYQGNVWGAGGRAAETYDEHNNGGYYMPAEWVNMVQRTQTSHLPDPYDPTPVEQGITVYYTDMLYGRVSFAILEDRKWKSGPDGLVPPGTERPDHITDPTIDPRVLDVPGAELLGERQLQFLDAWGEDWSGADLKVIVSQTAFAQVPNLHGPNLMHLVADLDSNGWPQTPRNEALRRFRKAYAFQVGGDQHVPMVLHYGIDEFDDAGYIFCVPAVATGYLRRFEPEEPGENRGAGDPPYTGSFFDGLGNRFTVHALANPSAERIDDVLALEAAKASGYGIVRIDTSARTFTMEAWPILSDPGRDDQQFPGWPKSIRMEDNYGRKAAAFLPQLIFQNRVDPVVQVIDEEDGEVVYTLRIRGDRFQPGVFGEGRYRVRIGDDTGWLTTLQGLEARAMGDAEPVRVDV